MSTRSITVGPTKNPFSKPGTTKPRPSTRISAPCASPESMKPTTRSRLSGDDRVYLLRSISTGADGNRPGLRTDLPHQSICPAPTATAAEIAMQRSPAEPNAAAASCSAANCMSASGSTTAWFFAPPSACTRFRSRLLGRAHTEQSESNRQMKRQRHRHDRAMHRQQLCRRAQRSTPRRKSGLCKPFGEHYRCRWISFRWSIRRYRHAT